MTPEMTEMVERIRKATHPEARRTMTYDKLPGSVVFRYFAPIRLEQNVIGNQVAAVTVYGEKQLRRCEALASGVYFWGLRCTLAEAEEALRAVGFPQRLLPSEFLPRIAAEEASLLESCKQDAYLRSLEPQAPLAG